MIEEVALRPVRHGVIYEAPRHEWHVYPEPFLHVGMTGPPASPTTVRAALLFTLPELAPDTILPRARLGLHITRNEPRGARKTVRVREIPNATWSAWTAAEEAAMPVRADLHLAADAGGEVELDLAELVSAWRAGRPNQGVFLSVTPSLPGVVTFDAEGEKAPVLRIVRAKPASPEGLSLMEVDAYTVRDSGQFPCRSLLVTNNGPGLAWVSPLYCFKGRPPLDPAGIPLGVLDPGQHLVIEPAIQSEGIAVRVQTAMEKTGVTVVGL